MGPYYAKITSELILLEETVCDLGFCIVRVFKRYGPASRLFWLSLTHGLKWNTIEKVAVPAKIQQVGLILVQVQSKMGQVRRFWCAVPDVFGFLDCGQMREMAAFRGIKLARMSYLAPTVIYSSTRSPI